MMQLDEIRADRNLVNTIDWEMTPEEAVRLYLEWGNNWARGNYVIRSKNDESLYFVVSTWKETPVIYLVRRNSEEAVELATIKMPPDLQESFMQSVGYNKGVYAINAELKAWLRDRLASN